MIHRYAEWCRRRAGTAQCSPALIFLGMFLALGIVIYIYRQVIITTVLVTLIAVGSVALTAALVAVTLNTIRWHRRRTIAHQLALQNAGTTVPAVVDVDGVRVIDGRVVDEKAARTMEAEAGWLEADEVDLSMGPDGKLKVRDSRS